MQCSAFALKAHSDYPFQAFLLDYGCTQLYRTLTGSDKFQVANANGTAMYISAFAHAGEAPHPRNDLQSLGYLMAYLANGSLPWQFEPSQAKLVERKLACSPDSIAGDAPAALEQWISTVNALPLGDPSLIPYAKLEALLQKQAPKNGKFSTAMLGGKAPLRSTGAAAAASGGGGTPPSPRKPRRKQATKPAAAKSTARRRTKAAPVLDLAQTTGSDESSSSDSDSDSSVSSLDTPPPKPSRRRTPAKRAAKRTRSASSSAPSATGASPAAAARRRAAMRPRRARRGAPAAAEAPVVSSSDDTHDASDSDSSISSVDTATAASPSPRKARRGATRSASPGPGEGGSDAAKDPLLEAASPPPTPAAGTMRLASGAQGVRTPGAMKLRSRAAAAASGGSNVCGTLTNALAGVALGSALAVGMTGAAAFLQK